MVGGHESECAESSREGEWVLVSSLLEIGDADGVVRDVVLTTVNSAGGVLMVEVALWSI